MKIEYNKDLTRLNTFGMKVSCACYVEFGSVGELSEIYKESEVRKFPQPFFHIGGGSNLLFTKDFSGTVFHSAIRFIRVCPRSGEQAGAFPSGSVGEAAGSGCCEVEAGSGVLWDDFCSWCSDRGLWGPENLSGIPGEVGAAAVQNIGAYGVEVKDIVRKVRCFDVVTGEERWLSVKDCRYGYRDSVFKDTAKGRYVVTSVVFRLSENSGPRLDYGHVRKAVAEYAGTGPLTPSQVRKTILEIRNSKLPDPAVVGSAGSFFKNPVVPKSSYDIVENYAKGKYGQDYAVPHFDAGSGFVKIPAAWLIEQCGWKGYREGNAGVYENQPLVIVNATGNATPDEILALERRITDSVRNLFGITLHPEVEHI